MYKHTNLECQIFSLLLKFVRSPLVWLELFLPAFVHLKLDLRATRLARVFSWLTACQ